jgi:hypothetical protein
MMAFVFLVLLAASGLQSVLTFLLIRENKKLTNGRATEARIAALSADVRAVERDVLGLTDLVATFGNRAAVKAQRSKKRKEVITDENEIPEEHAHLFGLEVNNDRETA